MIGLPIAIALWLLFVMGALCLYDLFESVGTQVAAL